MDQFPPRPLGLFRICSKIPINFAAQGAPLVSTTTAANLPPVSTTGAWGKLIHNKKPEVENLVALSLLMSRPRPEGGSDKESSTPKGHRETGGSPPNSSSGM
jgi:hypothetical protein